MVTSKPLRVLVIDDSAPFRRQVASALESSGLQVAEAGEGYEALWRVRAEGVFDLILADIYMPNMDGLSFIREVRKLSGYADVPIIVLTSDGSRERRAEGRLAGATAWVMKPPDLPALVHSVHAALLQIIKAESSNPKSSSPKPVSLRTGASVPTVQERPPSSRVLGARSLAPRSARSAPAAGRPALPSIDPSRRPKDPRDGSGR
jgi:two-component system chemotaxis response regulator CheY